MPIWDICQHPKKSAHTLIHCAHLLAAAPQVHVTAAELTEVYKIRARHGDLEIA